MDLSSLWGWNILEFYLSSATGWMRRHAMRRRNSLPKFQLVSVKRDATSLLNISAVMAEQPAGNLFS